MEATSLKKGETNIGDNTKHALILETQSPTTVNCQTDSLLDISDPSYNIDIEDLSTMDELSDSSEPSKDIYEDSTQNKNNLDTENSKQGSQNILVDCRSKRRMYKNHYDGDYRSHCRNDNSEIRKYSRHRSRLRNGRYPKNKSHSRNKSLSRLRIRRQQSHSIHNSLRKEGPNKDTLEDRRDPEKTRRDIQRDKLRCAKNQEARVFQEQLKVAETGLVPPGTELDVVLNFDKFKQLQDKYADIRDTPKTIHSKKKLSHKNQEHHSHFRLRESSRQRSREHSQLDRKKSYSPKHFRNKSYSKERIRRHKSPVKRNSKEIDLRYQLKKKREKCFSNFSFDLDKKKTFSSKTSNIRLNSLNLEPEVFPSRSNCQANHSKSRKSPKKLSFLEELEIKLKPTPTLTNGNDIQNVSYKQIDSSVPTSTAIPRDYILPRPLHSRDSSYVSQHIMYPLAMPFSAHSPMMGAPVQFSYLSTKISNPTPILPFKQPVPTDHLSTIPAEIYPHAVPKVIVPPEQLYDPNQILLTTSELESYAQGNQKYDNVTPNLSKVTPSELKNKLNVIMQCQEMLKKAEEQEKKNIKKLFIPKLEQTSQISKYTTVDHQSPLRKKLRVSFSFTMPCRANFVKITNMNSLSTQTNTKKITDNITQNRETSVPREASRVDAIVQTQLYKCKNCEKQVYKKNTTRSTQTIVDNLVDVSTQTTLEDLNKFCTVYVPHSNMKNSVASIQSISHLTPAQLLAQANVEKYQGKRYRMPSGQNTGGLYCDKLPSPGLLKTPTEETCSNTSERNFPGMSYNINSCNPLGNILNSLNSSYASEWHFSDNNHSSFNNWDSLQKKEKRF